VSHSQIAKYRSVFFLKNIESIRVLSTTGHIVAMKFDFNPETLPDLRGKVYLVTGGNNGM